MRRASVSVAKEFIVVTAFSRECKILNAEILNFKFDHETESLSALADEPIRIENRALGYSVRFILKEFTRSRMLLRFSVIPTYEELTPLEEDDTLRWAENRRRSYFGSLTHFLWALFADRLEEEGFEVYSADRIVFPRFDRPVGEKLAAKDLASPGGADFETRFSFSNYLLVIYRKRGEESEYSNYLRRQISAPGASPARFSNRQISWVSLNGPSVTVNADGRLYDPLALTTFGYWSFHRVAEMLPFEYKPE